LVFSVISFLQERKSAKARAQFAKFKNNRNKAIKQARAQERKGAIGVQEAEYRRQNSLFSAYGSCI